MQEKIKVLVVVGPTAVGKSAFGLELAQRFGGEVISGDSQQVYKGLDIGTAKVRPEEMLGVPHHLLDIRELTESFSAHDFVKLAETEIRAIASRGKLPIIVGGTGLYIQSLVEGYHLGGEANHPQMLALRAELSALTDDDLRARVKLPEFNRRRAIRILELEAYGSGENRPSAAFDFLILGLSAPRELLYARINSRVDQMLANGLLTEARLLFENYPDSQAVKAIGYKELFPYLAGELDLAEAIDLIKRHSRHYAKRQLTWFRNRMAVDFCDVSSAIFPENAIIRVEEFLNDRTG